jgi:hypothetical protein
VSDSHRGARPVASLRETLPIEVTVNYQEAARWAIDCQDACNLSGVTHSYDKAVSAVFEEAQKLGKGTDWINTHPIVTLFLSKLGSLNGGYFECEFGAAQDACERIAKEGA